jgi:CO/xanthine dehydrogenase Mo-binding subunit
MEAMEAIKRPMKRRDHDEKVSGRVRYTDDIQSPEFLTGRILRSSIAHGRIKAVRVPELPEGYFVVDHRDVGGANEVHIVLDDTPVFAAETVEFVGDPILMVVGPDERTVDRILKEIQVEYEELPAELDPLKATTHFFQYKIEKGDVAKAFAEADRVLEETLTTGHQEHVHLETNAMIAEWAPDGKVTVRGSMQCPYYVLRAVRKVLGCQECELNIVQEPTGGAFGGKEDYPSLLASQVAVAAVKAKRAVKVVFNRQEDIAYTPKRHPAVCKYKVAVKGGRVTAMDIDVTYDAGAYTTLSAVVLQRGSICANGIYDIPNLHVESRAAKTNSVPNGAFRGFGGPQTFFAVEVLMEHVAKALGEEPLDFKLRHAAKQGDETSTQGIFHFHVPTPEIAARLEALSGYREKRAAYAKQPAGRYRRGIGFSLVFHGCAFTGNGERDLIKAVARIRGNADGTVDVFTANTEMGQGLETTFPKLVAARLDIPVERVRLIGPETDLVPDSGPTVASRSIMIVGLILRRAADRLKQQWKPGETLTVEEHYQHPDYMIPFSLDTFKGDAYPDYSWSGNVVEVEVDTLTGEARTVACWGVYDVGVPIDEAVCHGQMQGGMLQGLGYASMEQINYNERGVIRNDKLSDYIIPTSMDAPPLISDFVLNPSVFGPMGAKGAGELPHVGVAPAYVLAMEQAVGVPLYKAPYTTEDALKALEGGEA